MLEDMIGSKAFGASTILDIIRRDFQNKNEVETILISGNSSSGTNN